MRTRSAPNVFSPLAAVETDKLLQLKQKEEESQQQQQRATRAKSRPPPSPEDETDVQLGPEHQAELPAVRPRPAAPTAEEARWVAGLVCQAGDAPPPPQHDAQQIAAVLAAGAEER